MSVALSQSPLFIIGSPRSGTSLLRLILSSHSRVLIPPECGFIIWLQNKYGDWCTADNNISIRTEAFIDDLLECKKMDTWNLSKIAIREHIHIHQPINYAELCVVVYLTYATSIGKVLEIWGDKNNFYLHHLGELRGLYKNARFLHIVRDGRDVACSYREAMSIQTESPYAPRLKTNISDISVEWSQNVLEVDSYMSLLPAYNAMTIKYEDLVSDPSSTITDICEWLGIAFEDNMITFYQDNISKDLEPIETLDWKKRTLNPISDETVGRYTKLLCESEQREFNKLAAVALKRFCYMQ